MKNKVQMGILAAVALFSSCSSDDDSASDSNVLFGKWAPTTTVVYGFAIPYEGHEACGKDYVEFLTDNSFRFVDIMECEENVVVGTYSTSGNVLSINSSALSTSGTYTIAGNTLSLTSSFDFNQDGQNETVVQNFERL